MPGQILGLALITKPSLNIYLRRGACSGGHRVAWTTATRIPIRIFCATRAAHLGSYKDMLVDLRVDSFVESVCNRWKFDTVDDKVGTALSLVYSTSKPILYVGVGQKYPNLK